MKLSTLCSGIGAPEVAAKRLGWDCLWGAEIEPFPSAVLAHHHPESVNHGDLTKLHGADLEKPDVLVFGSPCQSFSVAGKRVGLDDPRGDITLECLRIVGELLPEWIVWENVPGVLSIDGGRTFGTILGIVGQLGYGFAYRILDAQFFGVPQRRRRVFLVGHLGGWRSAAAVLFERESLRGDSPPSREKGERVAPTVAVGPPFSRTRNERVECGAMVPCGTFQNTGYGWWNENDVAESIRTPDGGGSMEANIIAHSLTTRHDSSEDGTGRGIPLVMAHGQGNAEVGEDVGTTLNCNHEAPIIFDPNQVTSPGNYSNPKEGDPCHPLVSAAPPIAILPPPLGFMWQSGIGGSFDEDGMGTLVKNQTPAVAFTQNTREEVRDLKDCAGACSSEPRTHQTTYVAFSAGNSAKARSIGLEEEMSPPLKAAESGLNQVPVMQSGMSVRRLTPRECCRLQGFPDDYTLIPYKGKPAADGPRYRALGNSMAVPVVECILRRIGMMR